MKKTTLALIAALSALGARDALAAQATSTFTVTATVNKTCTIATTTLDFTTYDPFLATDTTVTNAKGVTLTCSKGTGYVVSLSTGGGGAFATRQMSGPGTDKLSYNIFTDAGLGTIWGDGTGATGTVGGTAASKASFDLSMTGSIVAGQDVTQGVYADSITATVTF
jgi:spore coat protein U-like protein